MELKDVKGDVVFYYNRLAKKYYKLIQSVPIANRYDEINYFGGKQKECELKLDHSELVALDSKNSKESKIVDYYELVPIGRPKRFHYIIHEKQLQDKWVVKDRA